MQKSNIMLSLTLSALESTSLMQSCRKIRCYDPNNPNCENFNDLLKLTKEKPNIIVTELIGSRFYDTASDVTDTVYQQNSVFFKPSFTLPNAKYSWKLGSETIEEKQLIRGYFPKGNHSITLYIDYTKSGLMVGKRQYDTIYKKFYVESISTGGKDTSFIQKSVYWGTWEGANTDEPNKKFTFTIGYLTKTGSINFNFIGLPYGYLKQYKFYTQMQGRVDILVFFGYRKIVISSQGNSDWEGCFIKGIGIRQGNKITINYSYNQTVYNQWRKGERQTSEPLDFINKTWVGNKISQEVITE